ncbi:hypothetical protein TWF281_000223 [Arthrobotrys megalospora]
MAVNLLPYEILSQIFGSPALKHEDLLNILKVSRHWEKVVQPLAFRRLTIKYGTQSNWRPVDPEFDVFSDQLRHYKFVKSLTIELAGIKASEILVPLKISRCFPEVRSYQLLESISNLPWLVFWMLLDFAIFSAPKLTSLSIYRSITSTFDGDCPEDIPTIEHFPGRLQNLKEVTIYLYVRADGSSVIIDGFFRSLLKILGKGSENLSFNVKFLSLSMSGYHNWLFHEPLAPRRDWKLLNLRRLSFQDNFGDSSLAAGIISADYSKVKYLTMQRYAWLDFCDRSQFRSDSLGSDVILFPNVEVLRLKDWFEPSEDLSMWMYDLGQLKYFPKLRYVRVSSQYHHMEFPISHETNGEPIVEPGYEIEHILEFLPDSFPPPKPTVKRNAKDDYEELE